MLAVTRLSHPDDLDKIREEWADLHDQSGSVNPFTGPEWTTRWVRDLLPGSDEVWIVTVRDAGRLVGVAPMHVHPLRLGIRRLQMIGTGPPWVGPFESPELLAAPAYGRQVARAVLEHVTEHHREWHVATIALGDSGDWLEPGWVPAPDFTVVSFKSTPYVVLPLPMESRGPGESRRNLREAVRRARNRLTKAFGTDGWHVEAVTAPEEIRAAAGELVRLHRDRSQLTHRGEQHGDVLADARVRAYFLDVIDALAARDRVTVYRLVAGGETLAAQLVLHSNTGTFISLSGFRDDAWDYSPTNYLQSVAVADAEKRGHTEVNLSAWPTQAKLRWSRSVRVSPEFLVVGPSRFARAVAAPAFLAASALGGYRREVGASSLGALVPSLLRKQAG